MATLQNVQKAKLSYEDQLLVETLDGINRHGLGSIITVTKVETLKKGGRTTGNPVPDHLKNLRKVTYSTVSFHHNYGKGVQNRVNKSGNGGTFTTAPAKGVHPYTANKVVWQSDKNPNSLKMRYYFGFNSNTRVVVKYINEYDLPVEVTREEMEEYFKVKPRKVESKKQEALGVNSGEQIKVRSVNLENVMYVSKGEGCVFNRISDEILDILNLE